MSKLYAQENLVGSIYDLSTFNMLKIPNIESINEMIVKSIHLEDAEIILYPEDNYQGKSLCYEVKGVLQIKSIPFPVKSFTYKNLNLMKNFNDLLNQKLKSTNDCYMQ